MAKHKIYLGPVDSGLNGPLLVEGVAADAFLPGTLVAQIGDTLATSTASSATAIETLFAIEIPESEAGTIDTAVTVGDTAESVQLRSGEFANVRVATGQALIKGSPLISNADGTLALGTGALTEFTIAYADEAVTTTAVELVRVRKA